MLGLRRLSEMDVHMSDKSLNALAPLRLKIEVGGWHCVTKTLSLTKGKLIYEVMDFRKGQHAEIVTPSDEQWKDFRSALDRIVVWNWLKDYSTPVVIDGSYWEIKIIYADKKIISSGFGNYPTADGSSSGPKEYTRTYMQLIKAVRALIGKPRF